MLVISELPPHTLDCHFLLRNLFPLTLQKIVYCEFDKAKQIKYFHPPKCMFLEFEFSISTSDQL